jgi:hypothetical protein
MSYSVKLNSNDIIEFPKGETIERIVTFEGTPPEENAYYVVWKAELNEDNRQVAAFKYTKLPIEEEPLDLSFDRPKTQLNKTDLVTKEVPPNQIPPKYP